MWYTVYNILFSKYKSLYQAVVCLFPLGLFCSYQNKLKLVPCWIQLQYSISVVCFQLKSKIFFKKVLIAVFGFSAPVAFAPVCSAPVAAAPVCSAPVAAPVYVLFSQNSTQRPGVLAFSDDCRTGEGQGASPPTPIKFIPIHHLNPACSEIVSVRPDQYLLGFCGSTWYTWDTANEAVSDPIDSRKWIRRFLWNTEKQNIKHRSDYYERFMNCFNLIIEFSWLIGKFLV